MIVVAVLVVATAAAVRGVWSPCGLSMLSTITPIGERGRGNRYSTTARWYVTGAVAGGLCLGAVTASIASIVQASDGAQLWVLALAACIAVASDARVAGFALPVHRRQVNERWLDQYRPWVYGAGFGWQIGTGLCTYITSAATYLVVVLAVASGSPTVAVVSGVLFGLVRGLAVLLTRSIRTVDELHALHRRVQQLGPRLHLSVLVVEAALATAAALTIDRRLGLALGAVAAIAVARWRAGRIGEPVCDLDAHRRGDASRPGPTVTA